MKPWLRTEAHREDDVGDQEHSSQDRPSYVAEAALNKFIAVTDRLSQFEARLNGPGPSNPSLHICNVRRDQVRSLWDKVKKEFEICLETITAAGAGTSVLHNKYDYCYSVYETLAAQLSEQIEKATAPTTSTNPQSYIPSGFRLPPCDTEVFEGDYLKWPTFRDLFTAVYVNNPRLTPVEKLFHLNSKKRKRLFQNPRLPMTASRPPAYRSESESGRALKELQNTIQGCLVALAHSNISTENWDCLLVFLCASKLPKLTLSLWEQSLSSKSDIPTWEEMNTFLSERYRTLEAIEDMKPSISGIASKNPVASKKLNSFEAKVSTKPKTCDLCSKENHPVRMCSRFLQMSVDARSSYIKKKQLCLNCFARGHQLRDCTSTHSCATCHGRHHTLLHRGVPSPLPHSTINVSANTQPPAAPATTSSSGQPPAVQNYFAAGSTAVLLGTAMLDICHLGTKYRALALIDSGSEATFISERLFRLLKLPFRLINAKVSGLNQTVSAQSTRLCHFAISSPSKPGLQLNTEAYVLPELAGNLPSYPIPKEALTGLPNLPLADPTFFDSSRIDVLIGADILPSVLLSGTRTNICGSLLGQETIFGWVLTGPVSSTPNHDRVSAFTSQISETANREVLPKVEACLNSRPLNPMSENPSKFLALTPGYFLIGRPLFSTAEPEIKREARSIINRRQHSKAQHQQFTVRWKEEYLKELHKRNKWQAPDRNIQVGDMVVVKEDNIPSNDWRLGSRVGLSGSRQPGSRHRRVYFAGHY
ncbi:uncharacterized protein LOC122319762 [Drosophila ficusphila]|uniref:uncharacterized protein LOC122319762 n=1 Tax=Drosophila ficusphila TaxID=30025 RepID=UPI001C8A8F1D|nr:uncharacterized protein LOC122319762 [Drosophila ficusphila]